MHIVCSFTSGNFPFYDDKYGRVYYDDDDMINPCMIFEGLLYLWTFGYSQLAR